MLGDIESDAHGLRKQCVGQNNPHFQKEVAAAVKRFQKAKPHKPVPKYWQAHCRVLGLKARSYMGPVATRWQNCFEGFTIQASASRCKSTCGVQA